MWKRYSLHCDGEWAHLKHTTFKRTYRTFFNEIQIFPVFHIMDFFYLRSEDNLMLFAEASCDLNPKAISPGVCSICSGCAFLVHIIILHIFFAENAFKLQFWDTFFFNSLKHWAELFRGFLIPGFLEALTWSWLDWKGLLDDWRLPTRTALFFLRGRVFTGVSVISS